MFENSLWMYDYMIILISVYGFVFSFRFWKISFQFHFEVYRWPPLIQSLSNDWFFSLFTIKIQKFNAVPLVVVVVKLNETVECETNRLNDLKEVKWLQNLLLWIWPVDCFNDCVTAVKLITIIACYFTPAVGLSVPVSVTLRFRSLTRNRSGKRNTKSDLISFRFYFNLLQWLSRLGATGK